MLAKTTNLKQSTYIHGHRDTNHGQVDPIKASVFRQAIGDKSRPNEMDKVKVQSRIHNQKDGLLYPIPDSVDTDVLLTDLETSRNPDAENTDIDGKKDEES